MSPILKLLEFPLFSNGSNLGSFVIAGPIHLPVLDERWIVGYR